MPGKAAAVRFPAGSLGKIGPMQNTTSVIYFGRVSEGQPALNEGTKEPIKRLAASKNTAKPQETRSSHFLNG